MKKPVNKGGTEQSQHNQKKKKNEADSLDF